MDIFLDTSFIIPLIIETSTTRKARDFFTSVPGTCVASMSVYEETFFVGLRLIARDEFGITGTVRLKEHIRDKGYGFADEFIHNLNEVFSGLVIVPDSANLKLIDDTARAYGLLPNDALIVSTCIEHSIPKIATFDRDFFSVKNPLRVKISDTGRIFGKPCNPQYLKSPAVSIRKFLMFFAQKRHSSPTPLIHTRFPKLKPLPINPVLWVGVYPVARLFVISELSRTPVPHSDPFK